MSSNYISSESALTRLWAIVVCAIITCSICVLCTPCQALAAAKDDRQSLVAQGLRAQDLTAQSTYPILVAEFFGTKFSTNTFMLDYSFVTDYKYNKYKIEIVRLSDNVVVGSAEGDINYTEYGNLHIRVDATNWEPGQYKAVEYTYYYSFMDWRASPRNGTGGIPFWVVKPIDGKAIALSATSFEYNGKVHKPSVLTVGGESLVEGVDYTVSYSNEQSKEVGKYTVKVTGKGGYVGTSAKATYRITKGRNTLSAKTKPLNVGLSKSVAKTVKTKKYSAKNVFTVKKAIGEVTYVKKSGDGKISISSNGMVTVKKGLAHGAYPVKVKVTAKGNGNYKSKSVTVKLKVTV